MRWSWKIASVAGIGIYLHSTFLVLVAFIVLSEWGRTRHLGDALAGALVVGAIFASIVLHELGHALAARRFGIRTRDITLLPIGGIARLERMPDVPRQELWVALAGPAVNLAIAAVLTAFSVLVMHAGPALTLDPRGGQVLDRLTSINVGLAVFNLIPAFPMDGGRALRAFLAERLDYVRATEIAASLGQGLALVFGFIGLFANPFLVFIALFVWMGASGETSSVMLRAAVAGTPVGRAMMTDFRVLNSADTLQRAVDLVIGGAQRDFPVTDAGRLVGILTRDGMMAAVADRGPATMVRDVMTREFETADAREMLEPALVRLQASACPVLPVLHEHQLVGLLTADNIGEYVMIRGALGATRR